MLTIKFSKANLVNGFVWANAAHYVRRAEEWSLTLDSYVEEELRRVFAKKFTSFGTVWSNHLEPWELDGFYWDRYFEDGANGLDVVIDDDGHNISLWCKRTPSGVLKFFITISTEYADAIYDDDDELDWDSLEWDNDLEVTFDVTTQIRAALFGQYAGFWRFIISMTTKDDNTPNSNA